MAAQVAGCTRIWVLCIGPMPQACNGLTAQRSQGNLLEAPCCLYLWQQHAVLYFLLLCCLHAMNTDEFVNQNEVLTVASVSADGRTVTTVEALQFNHYGKDHDALAASTLWSLAAAGCLWSATVLTAHAFLTETCRGRVTGSEVHGIYGHIHGWAWCYIAAGLSMACAGGCAGYLSGSLPRRFSTLTEATAAEKRGLPIASCCTSMVVPWAVNCGGDGGGWGWR